MLEFVLQETLKNILFLKQIQTNIPNIFQHLKNMLFLYTSNSIKIRLFHIPKMASSMHESIRPKMTKSILNLK